MRRNLLMKCLLAGAVVSVGALADMTVDKSNGILTIISSSSGTVIAKVIGPNDEIIVDEIFKGTTFSWTPSGEDGAYRYDVRVGNDYAGGSIELENGQMKENVNRKVNQKGELL